MNTRLLSTVLTPLAFGTMLGMSGCTETTGGQRFSNSTDQAGAESFWASFEQNCDMAGLKLAKIRLPSGWAMRCWGSESACANWVTDQLVSSKLGLSNSAMRAEVAKACDDF